jgi:micrococcal nuclease
MIRFFIFSLLFTTACRSTNIKPLPEEISGKVISIRDGDTIEILFEGKSLPIRLAHVDCPEVKKKQPFGKAAKQFTSDLCFGQNVIVQNQNKFDRYKRLIGVVFNQNGVNINKELIKAGFAWHYTKYSKDHEYAELEINAKAQKVGLWGDESPIPPWDWR